MNSSKIESILKTSLPIQTVSQLEDFPFKSYSEFLEAHSSGQAQLLTRFDSEASEVLGTSKQRAFFFFLTNAPILVAIAILILSFILWNFWLLLGIPLAFIGIFFSSPFVIDLDHLFVGSIFMVSATGTASTTVSVTEFSY